MTEIPPTAIYRWFYATDIPKANHSPFKLTPAQPVKNTAANSWKSFSDRDSTAIESTFGNYENFRKENPEITDLDLPSSLTVNVPSGEDQLYETNVVYKEIKPVYWLGPVFDVRRGLWFSQLSNGNFQPCDDNLSRQLEDGYLKFQPWKEYTSKKPIESLDQSASNGTTDTTSIPPIPPALKKWALFGPFMNQSVVYTTSSHAWLQNEDVTGKLARVVISGTKLIRGWENVIAYRAKKPTKLSENDKKDAESASSNDPISPQNTKSSISVSESQTKMEDEEFEDREINHLIFVIHGIGQKLGERMDNVNFPGDCAVLRKNLISAAKYMSINKDQRPIKLPDNVPAHGGIQILPILWRQKLQFGQKKQDQSTDHISLEDITLDGVPSIRMLVSDVILDVLLYMTPKYRQEMVEHVSNELNRIYALYVSRNPKFKGKISLFGHSLGSLLAFDILSHQGDTQTEPAVLKKSSTEVDLSDLLGENTTYPNFSGIMARANINFKKLDFDVNVLFTVGSPIGLFLLLKGKRLSFSKNIDQKIDLPVDIPQVNRMYNIFHPHDPVAYRCEPLIDSRYKNMKPIYIPYTKGGLRSTIAGISGISNDIVGKAQSMFGNMTGFMNSTAGIVTRSLWFSSPKMENGKYEKDINVSNSELDIKTQGEYEFQAEIFNAEKKISSHNLQGDSNIRKPIGSMGSLTSKNEITVKATDEKEDFSPTLRIDYAIQEGIMENAYLSALGVHMNYWSDQDAAAFIVQEITRT